MHPTEGCDICPNCGWSSCDNQEVIGRKADLGKLRYDLIPPMALHETVKVLTFGSKKYSDDNWKKVPELKKRYYAAVQRHLWAWFRGEDLDQETGYHHLAHAQCCIMFILEFIKMEEANDK